MTLADVTRAYRLWLRLENRIRASGARFDIEQRGWVGGDESLKPIADKAWAIYWRRFEAWLVLQ